MAFHVRKSDQPNGFHIKDLMTKGQARVPALNILFAYVVQRWGNQVSQGRFATGISKRIDWSLTFIPSACFI